MSGASELSTTLDAAGAPLGLRRRDDLDEPGWTFWELRTLNRHRVVGLLHTVRAAAEPGDLGREIGEVIGGHFHRAWWRGLACGVAVEVASVAWSPADLASLVDIREQRRAILQWVVLASTEDRRAIGVHTWEEIFLSPIYREALRALSAAGYEVATAVKGKDGLMRFLTGVSKLEGVAFPEFHDRP